MTAYMPKKHGGWPVEYIRKRHNDLNRWEDRLKIYAFGLESYDELSYWTIEAVARFLFRGVISEDHYKHGGGDIAKGVFLACFLRRPVEWDDRWMPAIGIAYAIQSLSLEGTTLDIPGISATSPIRAHPGLLAEVRETHTNLRQGVKAKATAENERMTRKIARVNGMVQKAMRATFINDATHQLCERTSPSTGDTWRIRLSTLAKKSDTQSEWFRTLDIEVGLVLDLSAIKQEITALQEALRMFGMETLAAEALKQCGPRHLIYYNTESTIFRWLNGINAQTPTQEDQEKLQPWQCFIICVAFQYQDVIALSMIQSYQNVAAVLRLCKVHQGGDQTWLPSFGTYAEMPDRADSYLPTGFNALRQPSESKVETEDDEFERAAKLVKKSAEELAIKDHEKRMVTAQEQIYGGADGDDAPPDLPPSNSETGDAHTPQATTMAAPTCQNATDNSPKDSDEDRTKTTTMTEADETQSGITTFGQDEENRESQVNDLTETGTTVQALSIQADVMEQRVIDTEHKVRENKKIISDDTEAIERHAARIMSMTERIKCNAEGIKQCAEGMERNAERVEELTLMIKELQEKNNQQQVDLSRMADMLGASESRQ